MIVELAAGPTLLSPGGFDDLLAHESDGYSAKNLTSCSNFLLTLDSSSVG